MNDPRPEHRGELELIRRLRALLARSEDEARPPRPVAAPTVRFGDDMVTLHATLPDVLWTTDMLMDGVDFDSREHSWYAMGRKAMAVNLSDCAAMAVVPVAALCAVSLSNRLTMDDALELIRGAHECGLRFGCPIVGGDTNSWDAPTVVSITVAARISPGCPPVRRDGARPGDRIWVTGSLGGSILGRHMTFEPRVELALALSKALRPRAMIDISDGLALDLARILEASGRGAVLDETNLNAVIHPDAIRLAQRDGRPAREHALYDGEDFELIVVLPPDTEPNECARLGLLPLGRIVPDSGLWLRDSGGQTRPLSVAGWEHFR